MEYFKLKFSGKLFIQYRFSENALKYELRPANVLLAFRICADIEYLMTYKFSITVLLKDCACGFQQQKQGHFLTQFPVIRNTIENSNTYFTHNLTKLSILIRNIRFSSPLSKKK